MPSPEVTRFVESVLKTRMQSSWCFWKLVQKSMFRYAQELDDLPRSHRFWNIYFDKSLNESRLSEYATMKLRKNPDEKAALYIRACLSFGDGSFDANLWQSLVQFDEFHVSWPLVSMFRYYSYVGFAYQKDFDAMCEFLAKNDLLEEAIGFLEYGAKKEVPILLEEGQPIDTEEDARIVQEQLCEFRDLVKYWKPN